MILLKGISQFWSLCLQFTCLVVHVSSLQEDYSYVLCFMENDYTGTLTRDDTSIIIMNPTNDAAHVTVSRINASLVLFPEQSEILMVPGELYHMLGSGVQDKGIYIQSNGSIAVEGANRIKSSTDTFIVRPTHLLSQEYLVVTYCNGSQACQVAVVATANDSDIAIYFPYTVDLLMENGYSYTYGPNQNLLVVLQAHEVYQIQSSFDLTGIVITSNNPLACFAGANQTTLLEGKVDHVVDALPPTQAWGYEFIFAGNLLTSFSDIVKIIATEDDTVVDVDSCTHKTITLTKAFDYVEDSLTCGGYAIHSNFKIVVAHIRIKSNPGMYFPLPTNIFANAYAIYVQHPIVGAQTSTVIVYVRTSDVNNIILNGTLIYSNAWDAILNTEWSYLSVTVESGYLYIYNNLNKSFGGHLLVRNTFKLSVTNLIPVPYNENASVCCEHLEYKIGNMSSTVVMETTTMSSTTLADTGNTAASTQGMSSTVGSSAGAHISQNDSTETATVSSTTLADTGNTVATKHDCCTCVDNNFTKTTWTLQELRDMTMINKKNTSIAIRKLTSARDDRISAIGLGYCGIGVLCTVLASIISIDLSRYCCTSTKVSPKKRFC